MKYRHFLIILTIMFSLPGFIYAQVQADFLINYSTPNCAPAVVSFVNQSTGSGTLTYKWNFGLVPGTNSVQENPSASYLTCGTYDVKLTVTSSNGQSNSITKQVITFCEPKANFSVSSSGGCIPVNITFNAGSSVAGSGVINSYQWDFGDGAGSNVSNPSHTYIEDGCKPVTLIITNSKGCQYDTTIANAVCPQPPPVANFTSTAPVACAYPFNVTYSSTASGPNPPYTYQWTFQGGTPASSTQANPVVAYNLPGSFWTELIVTNSAGCKDTIRKYNYVTIATNVTEFTVDNTNMCNPGTVFAVAQNAQFTTSLSWSCTGGVMASTNTAENLISFDTPGSYQLCLTMNFPGNCSASKCTTIVINPTPKALFSETGNNKTCKPPLNVSFTNNSTGGTTYKWFFPGGTPASSTFQTPPEVKYNSCGNYDVKLIVTTTKGCTDTITKKRLVNIDCPVALITGFPLSGCAPLQVDFGSTTSSGTPTKWKWNFGDTPNPATVQSTQQNPTHIYSQIGNYDVTLIIENVQGCKDTVVMKRYVNIGDTSTAYFTADPVISCAGSPINFTNLSTNTSKVSTYKWDFIKAPPYDVMSTQKDPVYSYNDTGTFDVSLITCQYGCCDTLLIPEMIYIKPPVAVISIDKSCTDTRHVTLHGEKSIGADTYRWSIPGALPDTSNSPTLVAYFPNTGNYVATLEVYNFTTQCTHTSSQVINIRDLKADFITADTVACAPHDFCWTSTSTDASSYSWQIFDAQGHGVLSSPYPNPCQQFRIPGAYTTQLTVTDVNGCKDTKKIINNIKAYGLRVDFSSPTARYGCPPFMLQFFADITSTNVSVLSKIQWDFGDPSSGALNHDTLATTSHIYTKPGYYAVTLSAIDQKGCVSALTKADYVQVLKPDVKFSVVDTVACLNSPLCFIDSTTGAQPITYTWNFGDGTPDDNSKAPCHPFTTPGKYTITQYAQDWYGCRDTLVKPLYVRIINPKADFSADTTETNCPPLKVNFRNLSTDLDSKTKYNWEFGDGTSSTLLNPLHIYNKSGAYTIRLIVRTGSGCVDTIIKNQFIIVHGPTATITTSVTKGCVPQQVCFKATASTSLGYIWNSGDGNVNSGADTACNIYTLEGIFLPNVILSDSLGCTYAYPIDTIRIVPIKAGFITHNPYICQFGSSQFTDTSSSGVSITGYSWNFGDPSSGAANTTSLQNPTHLYGSEGDYPVSMEITNSYGCKATASDTIHVTPTPMVSFGLSDPVCPGSPVIFTDSTHSLAPIASYNWNFGDPAGGTNTSSSPNTSHVYNTPGVYIIKFTVNAVSGCRDSSDAVITIHDLPNVDAGPDKTLCFGSIAYLTATGAYHFRWRADSTLSDTTVYNPRAKPPVTNTYYVTGVDHYGCINTDSTVITVIQPYKMEVGHGAAVCRGQSIQLYASGAQSYQWYPTTGLDNPYVADPYATPAVSITYTVIGYDGFCFHNADTVSVVVHPIPAAYAGMDKVILAGESAPIGMPYTFLKYSWFPPDGLKCSTCSATEATPKGTTTYLLTVTNEFGCRMEDSVVIMVGCKEDIMFVPNAFTPNNDGIDDKFFIRSDGLSQLNFLRIYDRWGNLMYESGTLSDGWDGNYNGTPVNPGVYVYYMEVICTNGQRLQKQGNITLIK